ncbi:hypothetical protein I6E56_06170 [Salinibacterium sp. NK8237]|nr:hypothetical protein [Salinibacterium sp. NK8237]
MLTLLRARLGGDRGAALPMVIGITVVLGLLVTTAVVYSTTGFRQATTTQQWSAAMSAAYAGIEDYKSRLSEDTSYIRYGNPDADYTISTGSSVVLPDVSLENPAFNTESTEPWATVQGSDGEASYRYEVDNSDYADNGVVRVRSTGKVGNETRSIVADLRQEGFIDFLYFTDYEIQDPAFSNAASTCVKYWWAGRGSNCGEIGFGSNDDIDGPVHSNDTIRICDARFRGEVTTGYSPTNTSAIKYNAQNSNSQNCSGQTFDLAGYPRTAPVIGMPATNSEHLRETRSDLTSDGVPRPGCLYTGPTSITLNSNGTITVYSPWTKVTQIVGSPATSGSTPSECGNVAAMNTVGGATFTLPSNNVIYIQNVPSVSTDPNYWASNAYPTISSSPKKTLTCVGASGSKDSNGNGNGIGYPMTSEVAAAGSYGCRSGDLFVKGTLNGQTTLSAEHYIYVTGDITYHDDDDDILGLVGNDAVWVWNPVNSSNKSLLGNKNAGREINAAILSVAHTFATQNPTGDARGVLTVNGAIAQKFRGIISYGGGYIKDYNYDSRFRYLAPPKFLSPVTTTYGINVWIEVDSAYDSAGVATP